MNFNHSYIYTYLSYHTRLQQLRMTSGALSQPLLAFGHKGKANEPANKKANNGNSSSADGVETLDEVDVHMFEDDDLESTSVWQQLSPIIKELFTKFMASFVRKIIAGHPLAKGVSDTLTNIITDEIVSSVQEAASAAFFSFFRSNFSPSESILIQENLSPEALKDPKLKAKIQEAMQHVQLVSGGNSLLI